MQNCGSKRRQKGNKQDSLTGGNDLQRQHDGKGRMAAAGNGVLRTKSDVTRCLGGEWRFLDGARQGTRSDGWQRIGWRQGTAADGRLRRRWRDSTADIKACVCVCVGRLKSRLWHSHQRYFRKDGQVSPKKWNGNVWNCGTVSQIWRLNG